MLLPKFRLSLRMEEMVAGARRAEPRIPLFRTTSAAARHGSQPARNAARSKPACRGRRHVVLLVTICSSKGEEVEADNERPRSSARVFCPPRGAASHHVSLSTLVRLCFACLHSTSGAASTSLAANNSGEFRRHAAVESARLAKGRHDLPFSTRSREPAIPLPWQREATTNRHCATASRQRILTENKFRVITSRSE